MGAGVVAGIDWAFGGSCRLRGGLGWRGRGEVQLRPDAAAIRAMVRRLQAAGVAGVAIERGDSPVVEELAEAGLGVFVVPSRQIKGLRTRYGSAGNKDDRFDAYVLADTLRTDGHRWKPLRPDTERTRALRAACRSRKDLVEGVLNSLCKRGISAESVPGMAAQSLHVAGRRSSRSGWSDPSGRRDMYSASCGGIGKPGFSGVARPASGRTMPLPRGWSGVRSSRMPCGSSPTRG